MFYSIINYLEQKKPTCLDYFSSNTSKRFKIYTLSKFQIRGENIMELV